MAYPSTTVTTDTGVLGLATMWAAYKAEIDAGRPALVSFSRWVNDQVVPPPPTTTVDGFPNQTIQLYPWGAPNSEGGHTVAGVGYIDPTPAAFNGDELFVCQDNWGTTGQFVGVPVDGMWTQNDYVQNVPEPATLTLLVLAVRAPMRSTIG